MGLTCPPLSRFQDSLQQDLPAYWLEQSLYHLEGPIIPAPSERLGHPAGVITGGYLRKEDSGIFALYVCASSRVGGRDKKARRKFGSSFSELGISSPLTLNLLGNPLDLAGEPDTAGPDLMLTG